MSSSLSCTGAWNASSIFQVIPLDERLAIDKTDVPKQGRLPDGVRRESGTPASADATDRMQERTNRAVTLDRIFRDHS